MLSADPEDRLTLSRETLYKYRELPDGTRSQPEWLLGQVRDEIDILEEIAKRAPEYAPSVDLLVEAWQEFVLRLKRKAH